VGSALERLPAGPLAHVNLKIQVAGAAALAVWLYLLLGRGGFWRMRIPPSMAARPVTAPSVTAVIPARNEEAVVGAAVASLAAQTYTGAFRIVLVDDDSSDRTAEAARRAAPPELLTVVQSMPLPAGWTGKLWAVSQGVREAERQACDYLLLTDADIVHPADGLGELVARAEAGGYDLVSWMVTLRCESLAERALIPAFVFFFFLLYPPAWIQSPRRGTAGAAGGCMLIRREMLERIGGIARIRGELIDDCALAKAVKRQGGRVWLGLSAEARSIREYGTFGEIERMISRTAFTQLRHSVWLLAGTVAGLVLTYLVPPAVAATGNGLGVAAWALMSVAYLPALRFYGRSPLWAPMLPLVAAFYLGATVHSAIAYWRGAGGLWKGRAQDQR
jgi:hopene-associated glycosyltransferase HpnB